MSTQYNGLFPKERARKEPMFPYWVAGPTVRFLIGLIVTSGVLTGAIYYFPASQGQLKEVAQKVEHHDAAITEIKSGVARVEDKLDRVIEKLIPPPIQSSAPVPPPPPRKKEKVQMPKPGSGLRLF